MRYNDMCNQKEPHEANQIKVYCFCCQSRCSGSTRKLMPGSMFMVTIADVHGLLDEVGVVAAQASPMMNGPC